MVEPSAAFADGGVLPRRLLLVNEAIAVNLSGNVSIHSGRSIIVAPTASAAARVLMRMSASDQLANAGLLGVSGNHSPLPSALNLATYSVPSSSGCTPACIILRHGRAET